MADKTVTVGPSKTYATINAAMAAEYDDLTDAAYYSGGPGRLIIECYNQADTTEVDTVGQTWVTSADYYVWIKAMESHGGKYSTSSYRMEPTGGSECFDFDSDHSPGHIWITGIIMNVTGATSNALSMGAGVGSGWMKIEKCILIGDSENLHGYVCSENDIDLYIWNSVIYGFTATGSIGIRHNVGYDSYIYNCVIDDCYNGIDPSAGSERLKNTRITNCTTVAASEYIHSDSDYNLTDESTTIPSNWGANSIDGNDTPTISYVDSDNANLLLRDYHIESGDSGIGAGTSLSSDLDIPFSDDIDGTTRSSWDIGADEYESGESGGAKATINVFATAIQRASTW